MSNVRVRKQFNDNYDSKEYSTKLEPGSITQQNLKDQCDVNRIIGRYVKTGVMDHIKDLQPFYGDVIGVDYRDAHDKVLKAQSAFNALPAELRKMMDNDPANFVDWMSSPDDMELKERLGLIVSQERAKPTPGEAKKEKSEAVSDLPEQFEMKFQAKEKDAQSQSA